MFHHPNRFKIILLLFIVFTLVVSLQHVVGAEKNLLGDVPALPDTPYEYANVPLPEHFNQQRIQNADNMPADNPITNEGATLGRVLFYDVSLSVNDTRACASCHFQENGFTDPSQFSVGFEGGLTGRHSMSLANARYYENGAFFWDERAATLEAQALMPIQDPIEMGMPDLATLETKLSAIPYYPALFEDAFGTNEITSDRIARALAQFVRSIVSYQSKFDEGVANNFDNFTNQENMGRQIFQGPGNCDSCHRTAIHISDEPHNNGLDAQTIDAGVGGVTGDPEDDASFKAPSLRNIALSAPYMHDGRFETLEDVVEFYNSDVQAHPNLDQELQTQQGNPRRLNLNNNQRAALVAFLGTLTDDALVTDVKFSDPFVAGPTETPTPTMTQTPAATMSQTATATTSNTPIASNTATATNTSATPSPTATGTLVSPTATATGTLVSPSPTATGTLVSPTATATGTLVSPTATATGTLVVPTGGEYRLYLPMISR